METTTIKTTLDAAPVKELLGFDKVYTRIHKLEVSNFDSDMDMVLTSIDCWINDEPNFEPIHIDITKTDFGYKKEVIATATYGYTFFEDEIKRIRKTNEDYVTPDAPMTLEQKVDGNIMYVEYLAEQLDKNISFSDYIVEMLNIKSDYIELMSKYLNENDLPSLRDYHKLTKEEKEKLKH